VCADSYGRENGENGYDEYKVDSPAADIQATLGEGGLCLFHENAQYGDIQDIKVLLDAVQAHERAGNKDAINGVQAEIEKEEQLDVFIAKR
jgi:hypothetical protein